MFQTPSVIYGIVIGAAAAGIVGYEVYSEVAAIPPGEIGHTCGLGCTGEPVVTPLVAVLLAVPIIALLVRLRLRGNTEDESH